MLRRSQFTAVATALAGVALLLWTLLAPTDADALWRVDRPSPGSAQWVAAYAINLLTSPPVLYGAALLAGVWAARRGFHAMAGSTVLGTSLAASGAVVLNHYAPRGLSLDSAYPSPHVTAATAVAVLLVTLASTTRRTRPVVAAWVIATLAVGVLAALASLWLGNSRPTDAIAGILLGGFAASLANLLADVHLLRAPALATRRGRAAVIYNPAKVRDLPLLRGLIDADVADLGWEPALWLATQIDDPGPGQAAKALDEGVDLVLVAGGDGTVRNVCGALTGSELPIALIPSGTGNLLARNLGIPLDTERALDVAFHGTPSPVDLLRIDTDGSSTHAAVMAGVGADAAVLGDADEGLKKQIGPMAYVVAGLPHIRATPTPTTVTVDDAEPIQREASLIEIGNVGDLQAGVSLMPAAKADDGLLDVLIASPRHVGDVAQMMAGVLLSSTHEPLIDRLTGRTVTIRTERPMPFQIDGDVVGEVSDVRFEVIPGAVRILRPPAR